MNCTELALKEFLVTAKINTYAGDGVLCASLRLNSKDLHYNEGDLLYIDYYFGSADFIGEEVVFENQKPIWGMNYYGKMLIDEIPSGFSSPKSGYLSQYNLYFQFTITGYAKLLEPNVVDTNEAVKQMEQLARRYSPQQINWRFNPIILSIKGENEPIPDNFASARLKVFEALCRDISSFGVNRCTISFLCQYKKVEQRMKESKFTYLIPSQQQQIELVSQFVEIADKYGVTIYTCTSPIIEGVPGVKKGHCIDGAYLGALFGKRASHAKDAWQRKECGCTRSKDIGAYSGQSCGHGCLYCYAR